MIKHINEFAGHRPFDRQMPAKPPSGGGAGVRDTFASGFPFDRFGDARKPQDPSPRDPNSDTVEAFGIRYNGLTPVQAAEIEMIRDEAEAEIISAEGRIRIDSLWHRPVDDREYQALKAASVSKARFRIEKAVSGCGRVGREVIVPSFGKTKP